MNHFLTIEETPVAELHRVLEAALALRRRRQAGAAAPAVLAGKTLAMIFEKPSLRTRVSFEQAMYELGGQAIQLTGAEVGLNQREAAQDVARVLSGMVQGIMARVFEHQKLHDLARRSAIPVINALSDYSHPCQALADALTIMDEFGPDLRGRHVAFVGDGNNVARSLGMICAKLGMNFTLAAPPGYRLEDDYLERLQRLAPGGRFAVTDDARAAVADADVIYTDTWVSMGQESEKERRRRAFAGYAVDADLLAAAPNHAIVLHCLPAYRGYEISDEVIEGPRSRVFPQAHNRLHAQKGLLAVLMG